MTDDILSWYIRVVHPFVTLNISTTNCIPTMLPAVSAPKSQPWRVRFQASTTTMLWGQDRRPLHNDATAGRERWLKKEKGHFCFYIRLMQKKKITTIRILHPQIQKKKKRVNPGLNGVIYYNTPNKVSTSNKQQHCLLK